MINYWPRAQTCQTKIGSIRDKVAFEPLVEFLIEHWQCQ